MAFYTHTTINGRAYFGSQIMHWINLDALKNAWQQTNHDTGFINSKTTIEDLCGSDVPFASVCGASTTCRISFKKMKEFKALGVTIY